MYYTGIGSRKTPKEVLQQMTALAERFAKAGLILRSGKADGADWAFQVGAMNAGGRMTIYKPNDEFGDQLTLDRTNDFVVDGQLRAKCIEIVSKIHPAWDRCTENGRNLHARNVCQVIGHTISDDKIVPVFSKLVVFYAKEDAQGKPMGGTATAVNIARKAGIPTVNMYKKDWETRLEQTLWFLGLTK
jgi:hypothetical protein